MRMSIWVFVRAWGLVDGEEEVKTERREVWEEVRLIVSWSLLDPGMERKELDGGSEGGGELTFGGGELTLGGGELMLGGGDPTLGGGLWGARTRGGEGEKGT